MNMRTNFIYHTFRALTLLALGILSTTAQAGTFNWGDFVGTDVMYLNVSEQNNELTSLFAPEPGTGGPTIAGNTLHLDPVNFQSQSGGSTGTATDLIDSTLTTTIMSGPGGVIDSISISEFGDYSLGGLSGGEAFAEVGAAFFWTVLEVNNAPISLATQATNLILSAGSGPNGGRYDRPGDNGSAIIWTGVADIDLNAYLGSLNISGNVTKVRLRFDNTLQTGADSISNAFIKKKGIAITTVPEPTTALLLAFGLAAMPLYRRKRC